MKKFYLKPEAAFVDINLNNSVLEEPMDNPVSGNENRVWEESDDDDRLPSARSVWGDEVVQEQ
jgi:hypothetical protein